MDRFLIAPFQSGLETDLKPWLIPDDAFAEMNNAYVFRGRIRKRFGSDYTGSGGASGSRARLLLPSTRVSVGTTNGSGNLSGTVSGGVGLIGQKFSIGGEVFTCVRLGTPGVLATTGTSTTHTFDTSTGAFVFTGAAINSSVYFYVDGCGHSVSLAGVITGVLPGLIFKAGQQFMIQQQILTVVSTGAPAVLLSTGTYSGLLDTSTGFYSISGYTESPSPAVYFYPAEPITGLTQYEKGAANDHQSFAFDTQFVYKYSGGAWNGAATPLFTGDDKNFFWCSNWQGLTPDVVALFVTNFNSSTSVASPNGDSMYVYNGSTWSAFKPKFRVSSTSNAYMIQSARMIMPFKNRLLLFNTIESDSAGTTNISYTNRLRYSQNGSPLDANAFLQANEVGYQGGGYLDAPTEEDIVSASYIKDRLIVYFERSTWEVAYTGSASLPFVWQKINTELGSEATFSSVPFDKVVLTVGNVGIHACSGANVVRVDEKIPQKIFDIVNKTDGIERIAGIRDFYAEMVYWTFPSGNAASTSLYPNRILAFNYKNGSWAFFDDCVTAWGYFEQQDGYTWASTDLKWNSTNNTWESGSIQSQFRQVVAGNQQGFIFKALPDRSENASVLQVTNAIAATSTMTVIDHNLQPFDWVRFKNMTGLTITDTNYQVLRVVDSNNFIIAGSFSGTYTGGGTLSRISRINIQTKQWNPYGKDGRNVNLSKADFAVLRTSAGAVTVGYYPSSANVFMSPTVLETNPYSIYPLEAYQERLWHTVYFDADGSCVQLYITLSDDQMQDVAVTSSDFQLEGIVLHTQPTASRIG